MKGILIFLLRQKSHNVLFLILNVKVSKSHFTGLHYKLNPWALALISRVGEIIGFCLTESFFLTEFLQRPLKSCPLCTISVIKYSYQAAKGGTKATDGRKCALFFV